MTGGPRRRSPRRGEGPSRPDTIVDRRCRPPAPRPYRGPAVPPPIAQVEPLTTARALRGPFDYERPDGVGVGSVLGGPFGHRDVVGVVTGLVETSEHTVVAPRRVLETELPADLVHLALWMAGDYASTPARA